MHVPERFAYLILTGVFALIWGMLFAFCPRTRKLQFQISFLAAFLGPVIEILYLQDYWNPRSVFEFKLGFLRVLAEDIAFAFFFTGVTGMIAHFTGKPARSLKIKAINIQLVGVGIVSIIISLPLFWLRVNSIVATSVAFLIIAALIVRLRRDILTHALGCGSLTALLMFLIYGAGFQLVANSEEILKSVWFLYDVPLWGARLWRVPVTELVWGFSWGCMVGAVRNFFLD